MKNKKTLQQLIDEVMEEFVARNKQYIKKLEARKAYNDLSRCFGLFIGLNEDFLYQSFLKIAKATAKAGKVKPHWLDEGYWAGYNDAIKEQQQKLKEFFKGLDN